ncbi:MAG: hypothetical protein KC561_13940, partial [Myxococcales bacterium]|nr:hypothetical protein [Myxococcales bacterium]
WIAPKALMTDGLFDVVVWPWKGQLHHIINQGKTYKGTHTQLPEMITVRGREMTITSSQECLMDCDGEAPGGAPATVDLIPAAIRMLAVGPRPVKATER